MADCHGILSLPVELLLEVFSYLDVASFLRLASTCKALHSPHLLHEPSYWSSLVRSTFRVPNQPVVEQDGLRWHKLYKRLRTQSRVFTWGNNEKSCLGHAHWDTQRLQAVDARGHRMHIRRPPHSSWPERMLNVEGAGVVVADLQCGGWSTILLTAQGSLYSVGVIDGMLHQPIMQTPTPLPYPPGYASPHHRYDPSTAIQHFSAGRAHILALSDSGRIWSWHDASRPPFHVKFLHHDLVETGSKNRGGAVKKVVAGWNKSAALVGGTGIVVWEPLQRDNDDTSIADAALVMESEVVPYTTYTKNNDRPMRGKGENDSSALAGIGEVCNFVILEEVMLFNTHLGKVFVSHIRWDDAQQRVRAPMELPLEPEDDGQLPVVTDVQGSFKSFAVFTKSGAVLTGHQDSLIDFVQGQLGERRLFTRIPALQHRDVIQVAFGDYHFHALHSPGYITSYGEEPQHCGALGLGSSGGDGRLRGLIYHGRGGARLVPHASTEGRRVWFEKEKRIWVDFLVSGGVDPAECMERVRMAVGSPDTRCQAEVSEWIEQEGRDWESKLGLQDDDGLGAYFALSVAAAGWHSGALVLVNDELVEKMRVACEIPDEIDISDRVPNGDSSRQDKTSEKNSYAMPWLVNSIASTATDYGRWVLGLPPYHLANPSAPGLQTGERGSSRAGTQHPTEYGASPRAGFHYIWANDHFPRLVLSNGTEMPGMVPFEDWRYGRPGWILEAPW